MAHRSSQLDLRLRAAPRWGGPRDGAGRKAGPNPALRHAARECFRRTLPAHVTLRLRSDAPSLRTVPIVRAIERTFARGCERPGFRLVHYSLQGNHAHLIVEAQDQIAMGRGMMAIGARLARAVNRVARRTGPRPRRALSSPPAADAEGSARRAPLRAPQCPPTCDPGACHAHVRGAARPGVVRALVRRLAGEPTSRERRGSWGPRESAAGRTGEDVAIDGRLASPRSPRSCGRPRLSMGALNSLPHAP